MRRIRNFKEYDEVYGKLEGRGCILRTLLAIAYADAGGAPDYVLMQIAQSCPYNKLRYEYLGNYVVDETFDVAITTETVKAVSKVYSSMFEDTKW